MPKRHKQTSGAEILHVRFLTQLGMLFARFAAEMDDIAGDGYSGNRRKGPGPPSGAGVRAAFMMMAR